MIAAIGLAISQLVAGALGARAARDAARQTGRGITQAGIDVQGGIDRSLAYINAPVDTSLLMNRPYADSGIGAMANINALLGLPTQQGTTQDIEQFQTQMREARDRRHSVEVEIENMRRMLSERGGWSAQSYRMGGQYAGMHRDQMTDRIQELENQLQTLDTEYSGLERSYSEAVRQNSLVSQAASSAQGSGLQAIRPFEFSGSNFEQDPSYQFRLQQGLEALDRQYAARGGLGSGNRMIGITDYAQGLASTEYQSAFDRALTQWRSQFDVLNANLAVAGIGQNATGTNIGVLNNAGTNSANTIMTGTGQIAGMRTQGGIAQAAGTIGQNNAIQQTLSQLGYLGGQAGWFNNDSSNNYYDPYRPGGEMHGIPDIELR